MAKEKVKLWDKLKYKYKLSVINETSYEGVFNFRLSLLHVLMALSGLSVILVTLTILLVAFTGLREFIPGYPDGNLRQKIAGNAIRVDSLEEELNKRDRFMKSLQVMLSGGDSTSVARIRKDSLKGEHDSIRFQISQQESEFRAAMEEKERFNLGFGIKEPNKDYYHFFPPVEGIVTNSFDEEKRHFGTDIVAKSNAKVAAALDGVVIFTDWTVKTGYVILVQHVNDLVSVYKHNSTLLKQQGDYVRAGEVIAIVGNTGEESSGPHLHFELWRAGNPLNLENFMKFK
ncbi:M23 family metallopeptidase [Odoribacter sp. Z80]|uniref:M23 family metallopeptidase n=1 Tax=Odoribacter sp. Z80 TaxID=2304575 RepID=UPI00137AF9CF|nr:M23 family metallopeptidase [Odoribacter sp. Z80]NCE73057.1 M23 family peptidase [Odoribacter sp. Z80]